MYFHLKIWSPINVVKACNLSTTGKVTKISVKQRTIGRMTFVSWIGFDWNTFHGHSLYPDQSPSGVFLTKFWPQTGEAASPVKQ